MTDFTTAWHWPQWALVAWCFIRFSLMASSHGQPRLVTIGEEKGKVQKYNAFVALSQIALMLFVLVCGGFFA